MLRLICRYRLLFIQYILVRARTRPHNTQEHNGTVRVLLATVHGTYSYTRVERSRYYILP